MRLVDLIGDGVQAVVADVDAETDAGVVRRRSPAVAGEADGGAAHLAALVGEAEE